MDRRTLRRFRALIHWAIGGAKYDTDEIARVVLAKTRRAMAAGRMTEYVDPVTLAGTLLAVTSTAAWTDRRPLRVLDFGGAFGTAYVIAREATDVPLRWAVVETTAFVARDPRVGPMAMFDSIAAACQWLGGVDLVYTSGALQYTDDPEGTLGALLATNPLAIALLRTAFSVSRRTVEIQESRIGENGPGPLPEDVRDHRVFYPKTCVTEGAMLALLTPAYRGVVHLPSEHGDVWLWRHR